MQTIFSTFNLCVSHLEKSSTCATLEVEILMTHVLGMSRAELKAYPDKKLKRAQVRELMRLIERRAQGEPIAYLVGSQPFWTLNLKVTPETLIPRPETEQVVEWILKNLPGQQIQKIAELGAGSGAIALALAKEHPLWEIEATEISEPALSVARFNQAKHGISNVNFLQGSWCDPLKKTTYDLIVSNPPYIAPEDPHLPALRYEPQSALVAAQNGMQALKTIISEAKVYLKPGGILVLEHGFDQAAAVQVFLKENKYSEIESHKDYGQQDRFTSAKKDVENA